MQARISHIALFVLLSFSGGAQAVRHKISAAYTGVGAYSKTHKDAFSPLTNTASLASFTTPSLGLFAENRFLMEELNYYSAIVSLPTSAGNFGFTADYFGFEHFRETQIGLAFARSLGPALDVGIKFNYYSFHIPTVISSGAVNVELGLIVHLTEQFHAGFQIYNPIGGNLSKTQNEKLGSQYSFGLGYELSTNFLLTSQILKQENEPVAVLAAVQYRFAHSFFARAGVVTQNHVFFAGAGWRKKRLRIDALVSVHQQLGLSPGMMLTLEFGKNYESL